MAAVASKPNFAVVCSFLERYGASLELPEFTFPELEDALENKKAVPQPLVDLQLKLMRKIGKSVSIDRWEKYLLRICLEYNNTWAWEMEKIGYTEMDAECKLGLLKYLCECQFDDNLKFKNVLNEEEPDAMRIHPLGCDKDGLMYWYQLDQELNVRLYTEEQDDQDGTSWKLIVRDRNELAETLQLLKGQIDPALLTKLIQEDGSSRTSPSPEDEECKKEELEEHGREEMKIEEGLGEKPDEKRGLGEQQNELETVIESKPALPVASTSPEEDKKAHSVIKQRDAEGVKTEQPVKVGEPALEKNSEKGDVVKPTKDGNLERGSGEEGRASRGELVNRRSSGDGKACSARLTAVECEKLEISIKVEPIDDIKEKSSEELERALRNVKQAKLPVKKREIKLAKDYDSGVKGPVSKPVTPVNELLREGLKVVVEAGRPAGEGDGNGKQLVNGEVTAVPPANQRRIGEEKAEASAPSKTEVPRNGQVPEATRPAKEEENGIDGPGTKGTGAAASVARENHASVIKIKVSQNCVAKEKGAEPGLLELGKSTNETGSKCEDEESSKCSVDTNLADKTLPDTKPAECPKGAEEGCGDRVPLRRTRSASKPQSPEKSPAEDAPEKVEQVEEEEKKQEAEQSEVTCLRRSLRISKPTIKVTENQEKRASKKEEASAAQSPSKDESQGKVEKDSSLSRGTKRKAKANRRARWTKSRGRRRQEESSEESESDQDEEEAGEAEEGKPAEDDEPCKKCGLSNHPELILLCDSCDSGYHTACLRPPLMTIPDGEWFCPPCQHKFLCDKLEEQLENIDMMIKKKERAERRKERLAFVGINVENIITPKELLPEEPEIKDLKSLERRSGRTRRSINYRFDEFDDAIDEAIHEDIQEAEGKGTGRGKDMANITGQSLGKDISTILAEAKDSKRPLREAACRRKKRRRLNDLDSDSTLENEESEEEFKISESSEEEFEISERDSEADPDEDGFDVPRRGRHHKYSEPMRRSRRLRGREVKRYSDEDEEDEDERAESEGSSCYSDLLDMRRRRSKRNQAKKVNYREDSESEKSMKSGASRKERLRGHKRRLYITMSDESSSGRSSEEELEEEEEEEGRPQRKRPNRIEDEEDEEDEPALVSRLTARPCRDYSKKPAYRLMSEGEEEEEEEEEEEVGVAASAAAATATEKGAGPLDCGVAELPPSNGQNLVSRTSEKNQTSKPTAPAPAPAATTPGPALNGACDSEAGEAGAAPAPGAAEAGDEDEDDLLGVTDLVEYVCNNEQV